MVCIWHRICFAGENGTEDFHSAEKQSEQWNSITFKMQICQQYKNHANDRSQPQFDLKICNSATLKFHLFPTTSNQKTARIYWKIISECFKKS